MADNGSMIEQVETVSHQQLLTADIQALAPELEAYQAVFADCFGRREQREKCHTYLQGLLQPLPNKSIETMMLHNDGDNPNSIRAMQHFISQGAWEDGAVLGRHAVEVDKDLGDDEGVLIVDGSDFPKQGTESVGVKRQYRAPKLTLPQAILLLRAVLPQPQFDLDTTVEIVNYYQRRHEAAHLSHRKRRLAELKSEVSL